MIILDCGRPADFVSAGQCEHHLCDYRDDCGFQVGMMMVMVGDGWEGKGDACIFSQRYGLT